MRNLANLFFTLSFCLVSFITIKVHGQPLTYGNGVPITELAYNGVQGSPFLFDEWHKGSVALNNGKLFDNMLLKYNIKDDAVYFKNADDSQMAFKDEVKSFTLMDDKGFMHTFRNGYDECQGITEKSYLEVIAAGKTQFLKKDSKSITEAKQYGSTTVDRRFMESVKYYIYVTRTDDSGKGRMTVVKKDQKSIVGALKDKEDLLADYVQKNGLNLKNEADIAKLVNYYNTLKN